MILENDDMTLDILIHEYLTKKRHSNAANFFRQEAKIPDYNLTHNTPLLLDWFSAFNDIYNVRSGNVKNKDSISRIEAVMLKLENEKKKYHGRKEDQLDRLKEMKAPEKRHDDHWRGHGSNDGYLYGDDGYSSRNERSLYRNNGRMYYDSLKDEDSARGGYYSDDNAYNAYYKDRKRNERQYPTEESLGKYYPVDKRGNSHEDVSQYYAKQEQYYYYDKPLTFLAPISTLHVHTQRVTALCPGESFFITGSTDRSISIVDIRSMKPCIISLNKPVIDIKIHKDNEAKTETIFVATETEVLSFTSGSSDPVQTFCVQSTPIVSLDIAEDVLTLDVDGALRRWSFTGDLIENVILQGVKSFVCVGDGLALVSDRLKVILYDYVKDEVVREIVTSSGILKRYTNGYLIILRDSIYMLDKNFDIMNLINVNDMVQSACMMDDNTVLVGLYNCIQKHGKGQVMTAEVHVGVVCCIEVISGFGKKYVVTCSQEGECKVWECLV